MSYRVEWRKRSLHFLQGAIEFASDRAEGWKVISSFREAQLILEDRPDEAGESREDKARVLIAGNLAVFYEVFEEPETVLVYRIHYRGYPKIDV